MTKEKINIAIAEYCDWKLLKEREMWVWKHPTISHRMKWTANKDMAAQGVLPNYYEDLNAMFAAEKFLKEDDDHAFACYNVELLEKFGYTVSVSAADRAEMFVKIIGKWEGQE